MKRAESLQPLSRQHHNGLLMALLLTKGLRKNASLETMNDFISNGWKAELEEHFQMEEELLIPVSRQFGVEETLNQQLLNEHKQLRALVSKSISAESNTDDIEQFARLLEQHIRFEERVYFPRLEEILPEDILKSIGEKLHDDSSVNCINYPVKFWE